jgi:hypothetical protein
MRRSGAFPAFVTLATKMCPPTAGRPDPAATTARWLLRSTAHRPRIGRQGARRRCGYASS